MSTIDFLKKRFQDHPKSVALAINGGEITYENLSEAIDQKADFLRNSGICSGHVVVLKGDYSLNSISSLLALMHLGCIIVPITPESFAVLERSIEEVVPQFLIDCTSPVLTIEKFILSLLHLISIKFFIVEGCQAWSYLPRVLLENQRLLFMIFQNF